jgi:AraC family transcriptional regulator
MDEITIIDVPPQTVLGMRKKGTYDQIAVMLPELIAHIIHQKIEPCGPPLLILHDEGTKETKRAVNTCIADVEVAWPIRGDAPGSGDISRYILPGGRMARIVHRGPYTACEPTYHRLFNWLAQHNIPVTGPIRELYLTDPHTVPPEDVLTEILAPVG